MLPVVQWLLVVEALALGAAPLTARIFRPLADRGIPFSRVIGLLTATWLVWVIGSLLPVGGSWVAPWIAVASVSGISWLAFGRLAWAATKGTMRVILLEEAVFVLAFLGWALIRSLHPDIAGTEKPMDLMYLQTASRSASYPPQDLWLAGHSVNYYYFGYLLMAFLGHLAGTTPLVTFNLALAFLFGVAVSGSYSLLFCLTRSRAWAVLSPVLVVLLGNAHGFFQQVLVGRFPWTAAGWYWDSSRVVGETSPGAATTINEFPMFSFILGDLHPHLLAVPLCLLAVATALAIVLSNGHNPRLLCPELVLLGGLIAGSLVATNTWDVPTYGLILVVALAVASYRRRPGTARGWLVPLLGASTLLVTVGLITSLPFTLHYVSPTHGIGRVTTITSASQFMVVFGFQLCLTVGLLAVLVHEAGFVRTAGRRVIAAIPEAGSIDFSAPWRLEWIVALVALITVIAVILLQLWVLLLAFILGFGGLAGLTRLRNEPQDSFVLVLLLVAGVLILTTETVYVRDVFDGSSAYRLNTVFKLYFQLWILLGIAGSYAAFRTITRLWTLQRLLVTPAILILSIGTAIGGVYTVLGPISFYGASSGKTIAFGIHDLSGLETVHATDPSDYDAIRWMQAHMRGNARVLEATGGEYTTFSRVSTYTGLPTLLGWAGHEIQWRGNTPVIGYRHALIDRIYSTGDARLASRLLRSAGVDFVYIGPCERQVYAGGPVLCGPAPAVPSAPNALSKFAGFFARVYNREGVQIYRVKPR